MSLEWNFDPPNFDEILDRDVLLTGSYLSGKRIALLISGSIAAYRTPELVRGLRKEGADVTVYATSGGLCYVSKEALEWCSQNRVIDSFSLEAEHLNDSNPFDAFLVVPASYNTINKASIGIADSVVSTAIAAAIGRMERDGTPILFAPAMNGVMHNSILKSSLNDLKEIGAIIIPPNQIHGKNKLASLELIVASTIRALKKSSLSGKSLLITGGPTPVKLDSIRLITSSFTGALSIEIAREAWFNGADVELLLGEGSNPAPEYLNTNIFQTFTDYRTQVFNYLQNKSFDWGIFSAAAADFQPESVFEGKLSSKLRKLTLELLPTKKIIDEVKKRFPDLKMITFKYEENITHEELISVGKERLSKKNGPQIIVVNRSEEFESDGTQVAWILDNLNEPKKFVGKPMIANAVIERIKDKY